MGIYYYNRETKKIEKEHVYGVKAIKWLYQTKSGKKSSSILASWWVSAFFGWLQDFRWSHYKIDQFIKDYSIKMEEFLPQQGHTLHYPYYSFNDFFIRKR